MDIAHDLPIHRITFLKNWFDMAEAMTDGQARLAFYDSLFRYAFHGEMPAKPNTKSSMAGLAAWNAYHASKPVIDAYLAKSEAGSVGGSIGGRRGTGLAKARFGTSNGRAKR